MAGSVTITIIIRLLVYWSPTAQTQFYHYLVNCHKLVARKLETCSFTVPMITSLLVYWSPANTTRTVSHKSRSSITWSIVKKCVHVS